LLPFKSGPMNGREARESGLRWALASPANANYVEPARRS
jgi:hypothetical protein